MKENEKDVVVEFSTKLGLINQTDGTLFIYKQRKKGQSTKPDGYYYFEGITFILDAKKPGQKFTGQLEDYMSLETNKNFIGFKYNGDDIFECYVNGTLQKDELTLKDKEYYREKYFPKKINNEEIVESSAKKLADLFWKAHIDKQINVPFIGAVLLCMRFKNKAEIDVTSTNTVINTVKLGINNIIAEFPLTRKQKKVFIKKILDDDTLNETDSGKMFTIIQEISKIYNFINISANDYKGHDTMNNFLKVFRIWNSANAKEKGEVFTPDHIAQLMYKVSMCSKDNVILDPTCGSGTFLTNAMANMFNETRNSKEQKMIKETRLIGIDNVAFNATLAGINMLLHGDGASNIFKADCFEKIPELDECYDRVLMNPPFSQPDPELKFVHCALKYMKNDGYLSTILPKSCVNGRTEKNLEYLKKILNVSDLISVISLPRDLFQPNAGVDTCIMTLHKTNKPNSVETLLIDGTDDGFKLIAGKGRFDVENNWPLKQQKILKIFNGEFNEYSAVKKKLNFKDEMLFESFSTNRKVDIVKNVFEKYLREYAASRVLCGISIPAENRKKRANFDEPFAFKKIKISDFLYKISKGKNKSIDRKIEDKFDLSGYPLIVAKKDNNGVGGMIKNPDKIYEDKFCIIAGGDGGGGKTYYCNYKFAATSFVMIADIKENIKTYFDVYSKFYLSVLISERLFKTIGHGRTLTDIPKIEISIPIDKNGQIDFDYMSNYIKQLKFSDYL